MARPKKSKNTIRERFLTPEQIERNRLKIERQQQEAMQRVQRGQKPTFVYIPLQA